MSEKKANFEKLEREWYARLKAEGFNDIEYPNGSIQSGVPRSAKARDPEARQATEEYYYMAYHFLNEYQFDTEIDKIIWEYYSNGLSVRSIAKILKDTKVSTMKRMSIWTTINRLEQVMKAKYLSP